MLGVEADVPNRRLYVAPNLPEWLPSLELCGLQVGSERLDLIAWRDDGRSQFAVELQRGSRLEVCSGAAPSAEYAVEAGLEASA